MAKINYDTIDKDEFIKSLWHSLHEMAFLDIKRASDGRSKMGAFILASCFIEYLAGFRFGKETSGEDYRNFVKTYLPQYDKMKLYADLRCKLVHNYTEGGSYTFVDNNSELHMKRTIGNKIVLNLEDFISDIEIAKNKYFEELKSSDLIFKLAINRYAKLNVLGVNQLLILKK